MNPSGEHLVDGKYACRDLVDLDRLREMFEHFFQATGFSTELVSYPDLEVLFTTGSRDICAKFHQAVPASEELCQESHRKVTEQLGRSKETSISVCENNLVSGATPIIIDGVHLANLFTGQALFEPPDTDRFRKQAEEFGYDVDSYLEALEMVPVVTEKAFRGTLMYLADVAVSFADQGLATLKLRESAAAARKSEQKFRAIFDQAFQFVGLMKPDGTLIEANRPALELYGLNESDVLGKPFWEAPWWAHSEKQRDTLKDAVVRAAAGEFVRLEVFHPVPGGELIYVDLSIKPVRDDDGTITLLIPEGRDITDRKLAEERFRMAAQVSSDLIYEWHIANDSLVWYGDIDGALGCAPGEIPRTIEAWVKRIHPEDVARLADAVERHRTSTENIYYEYRVRREDGSWRNWVDRGSPVLDDQGRPFKWIGTCTDITERRRAEKALGESMERLKSFDKHGTEGVYRVDLARPMPVSLPREEMAEWVDKNAVVGEVNDSLARMYGLEPSAMIDRSAIDFAPDYGKRVADLFDLEDCRVINRLTEDVDKDGRPLYLNENYHGIIEDGHLVSIWGVQSNITDLKLAEERLHAERIFSDAIIQSMPGLFYMFDEHSARFVRRNDNWPKITGYTEEELDELTALDLVVDRDTCARRMQEVYDRGASTMEELLLTKSGQQIPHFFTGHRLVIQDRTYLVGMALDITDLKRAEEALRESEAKFRGLVESSSDWIWEVDGEGVCVYASPQVTDILGFTPAEVLGRTPFSFMPPKEAERVGNIFAGIRKSSGRIVNLETTCLHKDGSRVIIETSGVPLRDSTGDMIGYRGVNRDATDRKTSEHEKLELERQVQHAQKLESLGVLAGGIAHDFNNILMAILGNAELALDELAPHSPARHNLEEIEKASKRAADLATQMLAYSGKGRFVIICIDLNELVDEMTHLLDVSISKKAELRFNLEEKLPGIDGDATQIRQIIMNLITNASEAIGDRNGVVALATSVIDCDRAYLDAVDATFKSGSEEPLPEGRYVCLEVADTGCGMDRATIARIFDPFFTTKFTGRGLGMSAVLGIVRGHRGAINIYSEVGRGTTFKVLLPASQAPINETSVQAQPKPTTEGWRGKGTVLVVDDEETVRNVGVQMLEHLGFEVLTAADGREAVDLFGERGDEIACVLLDLTMPNMDGEEAFGEMTRIRPDVNVILCSGYNEQEATQRFSGQGLASFLQKPYSFSTLKAKLMHILE
ncbi:MAG: PAS domain S-box protein [bacterium]|nr:PAS domain S-box protein [bacterium]